MGNDGRNVSEHHIKYEKKLAANVLCSLFNRSLTSSKAYASKLFPKLPKGDTSMVAAATGHIKVVEYICILSVSHVCFSTLVT